MAYMCDGVLIGLSLPWKNSDVLKRRKKNLLSVADRFVASFGVMTFLVK